MNRQFLADLDQYFRAKTEMMAAIEREKPDFDIAFINRKTIERKGFVADNLSDGDMEELAGSIGDIVCGSEEFDYAIEKACKDMDLEAIHNCPLCEALATYDPKSQSYTCNSCGQKWHDERYVLVESPEQTRYLPFGMGYPSNSTQNDEARYIQEYDYFQLFHEFPDDNSYYEPVCWPESQKYMPNEDSDPAGDSIDALNELINDEKGLADFGQQAVWIPLCNIKN